jgi:hypothetical protein
VMIGLGEPAAFILDAPGGDQFDGQEAIR